ncbi:MAG: hypothetical protein DI570_04880 [Phenylobacterium zucineum]|nr:MAG: hypothetical protein DI570_04880 [Phenylobacterium zucineum]
MFQKLRRAWHDRDIERRIAKRGWTGIYVGDYASAPTWTYSVGFQQSLGQPEIVIFDVPHEAANSILWTAYEELKAGTLVLEDGKRWHAEDEEKPLVWRKVHRTQIESRVGWLTLANARRLTQTGAMFDVEAYQLVLSDEAGRMPWEEGYNEWLRHRQPALYLPARDYGDAPLSPPEEEALRIADERGWSIMRVPGRELNWAYTIGLAEAGLPELVAFLPTADMAANAVHQTRDCLVRGEVRPADGLRWDGAGFEACFRRLDDEQFLALGALRLSKLRHETLTGRREAVETYQIFLPDEAGRYPWEPGCLKSVAASQPPLYQPFDWDQGQRGPLAALMRM